MIDITVRGHDLPTKLNTAELLAALPPGCAVSAVAAGTATRTIEVEVEVEVASANVLEEAIPTREQPRAEMAAEAVTLAREEEPPPEAKPVFEIRTVTCAVEPQLTVHAPPGTDPEKVLAAVRAHRPAQSDAEARAAADAAEESGRRLLAGLRERLAVIEARLGTLEGRK